MRPVTYRTRLRTDRSGFALLTALWLIVAIATVALEFSLQARERRRTAINIAERSQALAASQAGIATTQARITRLVTAVMNGQSVGGIGNSFGSMQGDDRNDPMRWADSLFTDSAGLGLGAGSFGVFVRDAGTFLNVNSLTEGRWRALFAAVGIDYGVADQLAHAILDWIDPDAESRGRGAERDDYIRAGRLVLPANGPMTSVSDLRDVMGMTPDIYQRVAPYLTTLAVGQVNINKADPEVLRTLPGITDEIVSAILMQRYSGVPIRTINDLTRLIPGMGNNRFTEAQPGEPPLAAVMTFRTQEVIVTSIGWSVGGHTSVTTQATLYLRSSPTAPQLLIRTRQVL